MQDKFSISKLKVVFGAELHRLMEKHGRTMADLAREFRVSHPAVQKWLKNTIPAGDKLAEIARYFQVSADELLYGLDDKITATKRAPSGVEVLTMLHSLPPTQRHLVIRKAFAESLRECDVPLTEADFKRGWVEASLQYKTGDVPEGWPAKVRIYRMEPEGASVILRSALAHNDEELILIATVEKPFVTLGRKKDPFRMLTPFSRFALARAAVRLNYGDASAPKLLKDLGCGFYLDLLSDADE